MPKQSERDKETKDGDGSVNVSTIGTRNYRTVIDANCSVSIALTLPFLGKWLFALLSAKCHPPPPVFHSPTDRLHNDVAASANIFGDSLRAAFEKLQLKLIRLSGKRERGRGEGVVVVVDGATNWFIIHERLLAACPL